MEGEDHLLSGGGGSGGDVIEEGDVSAEVMEKGSLSPLTGSYLLIVLAEPHSEEDREIILERLNKGLLSWDVDSSHVDLNCELLNLANSSPEGDEARNGEKLVQWASENLVVEVLIHSQVNTLQQCMKNLLASFTRHRHIIHSGYTFQGSGSWVLQDGTFSLNDYLELWGEPEVQRILSAYKGDVSVAVHCASENGWTQERLSKEPFARMCQIHMNPTATEKMSHVHNAGVSSFIEYISKLLIPSPLKEILEPSEIVGNIRFSHPTLYVFPGGQGDAALFGINGFNMLIDGGFSRRSCFWDFTRHLDRLDAVLLTRVNNNSVGGLSSVIQRKVMNQVYPQIGHFFGNVIERKGTGGGDKDKEKEKEKGGEVEHQHGEKLLVSLTDEGQKMLDNLRNINLKPHLCFRETHIEPINLYHKVGHGKLDLYILNPAKDSREVKEFLSKWNSDCKSFVSSRISVRQAQQQDGKDFQYPVLNLVSICALLVWQPANPRDPITRILFPGSTPQHKIFEALQKLKHLEFLKYPVCSAKTIAASNKSKVKSEKVISEAKQQLSKVSSHANVTGGSSLQASSTEGSLSRAGGGLTTSISKTASTTSSTLNKHSSSTVKSMEEKERERSARGKSKIGLVGDSNKVQATKMESPASKRQPRSTSKSASGTTGGVGIGKMPSATRVPSKGPPSTRRSGGETTTGEKIPTSTIPKKISPTSPAKKAMGDGSKIGVKSSSLSKTGTRPSDTPPPSTPPKSAKESANNRRVIEYKSHLKSNVKTEGQQKTLKSGEIKKRVSSTTSSSSMTKSIPKSPPSSHPVAVKRSISDRNKVAGVKEIITGGGVVKAEISQKEETPPPSQQPEEQNPLKISSQDGDGDLGENEEKKIQAEINGSIISRGEGDGEDEQEDKSQHDDQQEEPTSLPPPAFLPTESGSELSSLDHMSLHEEEVEHQQQTRTVISSTQDLSLSVDQDQGGEDEQQPFDSLTLQDDGVVESEQDEEEEEDEYLIVEKDESTADNAAETLSERVQSKLAVGSLDEISAAIEADKILLTKDEEQEKDSLEPQEEEEGGETVDKKIEEKDGDNLTNLKESGDTDAGTVSVGETGEELVETDAVESLVQSTLVQEEESSMEKDNLDKVIKNKEEEEKVEEKGEEMLLKIVPKSLADELESAIDDEERRVNGEKGVVVDSLDSKEQESGDDNGGREEVQSIVECSSVKNALERESNILELNESVAEQLEVGRCIKENEEEGRDHDIPLEHVQEDEECEEKVGGNESENIVAKDDFSTPSTTSNIPLGVEEFPGNNLAFQGEADKVEELVLQLSQPKDDSPSPILHIREEEEREGEGEEKLDEGNGESETPLRVQQDAVSLDGKMEEVHELPVLGEKSPYDTHQELTQQDVVEEQVELKIKSLQEQEQIQGEGKKEEEGEELQQEIKDLEGQDDDEMGEKKLDHVSSSLVLDELDHKTCVVEQTGDDSDEVIVEEKINSQEIMNESQEVVVFKEDSEESEKGKDTNEGHVETEDSEKTSAQKESQDLTGLTEVVTGSQGKQGLDIVVESEKVESTTKEGESEDQVLTEIKDSPLEKTQESLPLDSTTLTKEKEEEEEEKVENILEAEISRETKQAEEEEKVEQPPQEEEKLDKEEEIRGETLLKEDQKDVGHEELKENEDEVIEKKEDEKMLLDQKTQPEDQQGREEEEKLADVVQRDDDKLDSCIPTPIKVEKEQGEPGADEKSLEKLGTDEIVDVKLKEQQSMNASILEEPHKSQDGEESGHKVEELKETETEDEKEVSDNDKFIRPLPYEETMDSEGALDKILLMKDTRDVKEGKSSLIDNEGGERKLKEPSGIASAIPKLPRESREVIRTPDEVAELPMHEEVEPGTYETDEVLSEHEPEEFSGSLEDPGVETIGISNLPQKHPSPSSQDDVVEDEKIEQINISHESTLPPLFDPTTTPIAHKVEHVHQEIILSSETSPGGVKKCDAAVSPVLESLLGQSPPKIFPGEESIINVEITNQTLDQVDKVVEEENGNIIVEQIKETEMTKEISQQEKGGEETQDKNQLIETTEVETEEQTREEKLEEESELNIEQEDKSRTDKKLTIGRDKERDEELSGLETKPITSVVITPSTPPVHKDLEKSEFSYPAEQTHEPTGVSLSNGEETEGGVVTSSEINDAVKLERVEEESEKSKASPTPAPPTSTTLLSGGEHERKLSDNSDESSTSSATPLTAVSKDSKDTPAETKIEEQVEQEEFQEKITVTHLPESIQDMEKVIVEEDDMEVGIVRGEIAVKCDDVEKLFLLPGKDDNKSDVDDDDIYETDEPALGAIRSGLLTAATTLSAAVISQSPEHLATIPSFNENEMESIMAKSLATQSTCSVIPSKNESSGPLVEDETKSKVFHESQIKDEPATRTSRSSIGGDDEKTSGDNVDSQSGKKSSIGEIVCAERSLSNDDKNEGGNEDYDENVKMVEDHVNTCVDSRRSSGGESGTSCGKESRVIETKTDSTLDSGSVVDGSILKECSGEDILDETREESHISCAHVELANKLLSFEQKEEPEEISHENIEPSPPLLLSTPTSRKNSSEPMEKREEGEEKRDQEKPVVLPSTSQSIESSQQAELQKQENIADGSNTQIYSQIGALLPPDSSKSLSTSASDDKQSLTTDQREQLTIEPDQGLVIDKQINRLIGSETSAHEHQDKQLFSVATVNAPIQQTLSKDSETTKEEDDDDAITGEVNVIKQDKSISHFDINGEQQSLSTGGDILQTKEIKEDVQMDNDIILQSTPIHYDEKNQEIGSSGGFSDTLKKLEVSQAEQVVSAVIEAADRKVEEETKLAEEILLQVEEKLLVTTPPHSTSTPVILDKECVDEKCDKEKVLEGQEEKEEGEEEEKFQKISTTQPDKKSPTPADPLLVPVDIVVKSTSKDKEKEEGENEEVNNLVTEGLHTVQEQEDHGVESSIEENVKDVEKDGKECVEEKAEEESSEKSIVRVLQTEPLPSTSLTEINTTSASTTNISVVETNAKEPSTSNLEAVLSSQFNLGESEQNKSILNSTSSPSSTCVASQLHEDSSLFHSVEILKDANSNPPSLVHEEQDDGKEQEISQSLVTHASDKATTASGSSSGGGISQESKISKPIQHSSDDTLLSARVKSESVDGEGQEDSIIITGETTTSPFPSQPETQQDCTLSSVTCDETQIKISEITSQTLTKEMPLSHSIFDTTKIVKESASSIVTDIKSSSSSSMTMTGQSERDGVEVESIIEKSIKTCTDSSELDKQMSALISQAEVEIEESHKISHNGGNLSQLEIEKKISSSDMESSYTKDNQPEITKSHSDSAQLKESSSTSFSHSESQKKEEEKLSLQGETVVEKEERLQDLSSSKIEETSHSSILHRSETTSKVINLDEKSNIEKDQFSSSHHQQQAQSSSTSTSTMESLSRKSLSKDMDFDDLAIAVKDQEIQQQFSSSLNQKEVEQVESQKELRKSSTEFTTLENKTSTSASSFISSQTSQEKMIEVGGGDFEENVLEKSLLSSMQETGSGSGESRKSDIVKTDRGTKTTITRRFSSQEMEGVVGESVKSMESRRRASEIIEHSEEIYTPTSLSRGSTAGVERSSIGESSALAKQFVEIVERDNEMVGSRTSPGGSFYGGYGYVFGSAADDETEENPEDEESVYGGEDSQSQSLSTRDSNQSIIISTDFIPSSTTSASTSTTCTTSTTQSVLEKDEDETSKIDTKEKTSQPLHFETSSTSGEEKSQIFLGDSKSTSHITMSYDLMDEGSYSSGDFSDSQLSTVAGREQSGLDDDNVHNYGYESVNVVHQQDDKIKPPSSQDFENGNLPCTTTTNIVTSTSNVPIETTATTTTTTSSTILKSSNNGNTPPTTTTTSITCTTNVEGESSKTSGVSVDGSTFSSEYEFSSTSAPSSSSSSRLKETEGEDIVKTWGKPLGLPPIQPDDQQPLSSNFHETAPSAPTTTAAATDSGLARGTPKKDKSVDRKNPTTPGKTIHGSSTSRGRSHHRSSKNISPIYVDLAYVPHHGNSNYCDSEFFRLVRSRYYVFSGLEPSRQVFDGLLHGKQSWEDKNLEVTIIPTYDTDTLGYWVVDSEDALSDARIDLAPSASRCTINLQDHETSCSAYRLEF